MKQEGRAGHARPLQERGVGAGHARPEAGKEREEDEDVFPIRAFMAIPLALALPAAQVAAGESPKDEGITRQQADDILNELRQIRHLLEKQQAKGSGQRDRADPCAPSSISTGSRCWATRTLRSPWWSSPITSVPSASSSTLTTYAELKKNYIDTGKLRFYSRDLPLDFHANAMRAAEAARCAADQGKFWQLRDIMGANPDKLEMANLVEDATGLKMDVAAFRTCVESEKYKNAVQTDVMEAMKIGADGTPTFVVGKSTADGVDGEVVLGALPYPMFDEKLKEIK